MRRVIGAGFALTRDAGRRPTLRCRARFTRVSETRFRPPPAGCAGLKTGVPWLPRSGADLEVGGQFSRWGPLGSRPLRPSGHDEGSEGFQAGEGPLYVLRGVVEVRREAEAA